MGLRPRASGHARKRFLNRKLPWVLFALGTLLISSTIAVWVMESDANAWKMHIQGGQIHYEQPAISPAVKKHTGFSDANYSFKMWLLEQLLALDEKYPTQALHQIIDDVWAKTPGTIVDKTQAIMDTIEQSYCPIPEPVKKQILEKANAIENPVPRTDVSVPPPTKKFEAKPIHSGVPARISGAGDTNTWTNGNATGIWSDDLNWSLGHKPSTGENVVFDSTNTANCQLNEASVNRLGNVSMNAGYSGTFSFASTGNIKLYCVNFTLTAGTFVPHLGAGPNSWIDATGNVTRSGGTYTTDTLYLSMGGNNTTLNWLGVTGTNHIWGLSIASGITVNITEAHIRYQFFVGASSVVNVTTLEFLYTSPTFSNSGTIQGAGTLGIYVATNSSITVTFGTVNCNVLISNMVTNNNQSFTLGANTTLGANLTIYSTYTGASDFTLTITGGVSNRTLSVTGLTTIGNGSATGNQKKCALIQTAGSYAFGNGLIINGTNTKFTQGSAITSTDITLTLGTFIEASAMITASGSIDLSGGTVTNSTASFTLTGTSKTLKLPAGNYTIAGLSVSGTITLASTVTTGTIAVTAGSFSISTYTFTNTSTGTFSVDYNQSTAGTWNCNGATAFQNFTISSGTFVQGANITSIASTWTSGTMTFSSTWTWTASGSVTGAVAPGNNLLRLIMTGASNLSLSGTDSTHVLNSLQISNNVTLTGTTHVNNLTVDNAKTLSINTAKILYMYSGNTLGSTGTINGAGTFQLEVSANWTITPPVINGIFVIHLLATGATSTVLLGGALATPTSITISSSHATNTVTLDLSASNYALSCADLTIGNLGGINCRGSTLTVAGNVDSSGTSSIWTYGTSLINLTGTTKTLKMLAGQSFYDLTISGSYSEASTILVSHNLIVSGSLLHGSNCILTVTGTTSNTGTMTQGSSTWSFGGGYSQSGSAVFNMGASVNSGAVTASGGSLILSNLQTWICSASWNTNGATLTPGTSLVFFTGTGIITLGAGQAFYDLTINIGASYSLGSDIACTHSFKWDAPLSFSGYILDNSAGTATVSTDFASATAGTFMAGSAIDCTASWDTSNITFVQGTSLVTLYGTGETIKLSAGQSFFDLTVAGSYSLLSSPPLFSSIGIATASEDVSYTYLPSFTISVSNILLITGSLADQAVDSFGLTTNATFLLQFAGNGTIYGTPNNAFSNRYYSVSLSATYSGKTSWQNFTLTVINRPPVFSSFPVIIPIVNGGSFTYDTQCDDEGVGTPPGNYSILQTNYPGLYSFNRLTGVFSVTASVAGTFWFNITANDERGAPNSTASYQNFTLQFLPASPSGGNGGGNGAKPVTGFPSVLNVTYRIMDNVVYFTLKMPSHFKVISWSFGDTGMSKDMNPTHIYQRIGSYIITLSVDDGTGQIITGTMTVKITEIRPPLLIGNGVLSIIISGNIYDIPGFLFLIGGIALIFISRSEGIPAWSKLPAKVRFVIAIIIVIIGGYITLWS